MKYMLAVVLLLLSVAFGEEEEATCENPITHSFTCTTTSLCNDNADALASSLCYRVRACLFGMCSTTDLTESESIEEICGLVEDQVDEEEICLDGWDSSWWMTEYIEAVDCSNTSAVYLDCTELIGDISASTAASMGFSVAGLGVTALVMGLLVRRNRRLSVAEYDGSALGATEMKTLSDFERLS